MQNIFIVPAMQHGHHAKPLNRIMLAALGENIYPIREYIFSQLAANIVRYLHLKIPISL